MSTAVAPLLVPARPAAAPPLDCRRRRRRCGVRPHGGVDVAELYPRLERRLRRIVRFGVSAPDAVIDDACQFAWSALLRNADRVEQRTVLGWLARTAHNEALKLVRREGREPSLEEVLELAGEAALGAVAGPDETIEQRERIASVAALPERQRRALLLHALGFSYREIAATSGDSARTVERQLLRGKRRLRAIAAESD